MTTEAPVKPLLTRTRRLEQVYEGYRSEPELSHLRYRTRLVEGYGNTKPHIVFVGEAPGAEEERSGRPFVGASGRVLDDMLGSIGMKRNQCFITNIVKYRPPNNRDPRPDEVAASLPYLLEEVRILRPKVIVPLGRFALNVFFPNARISSVRGEVLRRDRMTYVPLFHPAVCLYNPGTKAMMFDDFRKLGDLL